MGKVFDSIKKNPVYIKKDKLKNPKRDHVKV